MALVLSFLGIILCVFATTYETNLVHLSVAIHSILLITCKKLFMINIFVNSRKYFICCVISTFSYLTR
jgi:hypothetical protein